MKNRFNYRPFLLAILTLILVGCSEDFLELEPRGTDLEDNFYQTEEEFFQGLVAVYDVLQWGGTHGWTMQLGLMNAISDDCYAGGSDASDQPSWVAMDAFTIDPFLGPQRGFWEKGYYGIYRANIFLSRVAATSVVTEEFKARTVAEAKFLRAFYYFDLVRLFGNVPLITDVLGADDIYTQVQASPAEVYAFIEQDLNDALATFELPATVPASELGRITRGAVNALLGKVILYQNDESRMAEAASLFEEVISSGLYQLETNFEDIFKTNHEFGVESVFEINFSDKHRGGWGNFGNQTEGNYNVQFFGMRDYVGPTYTGGYGFCPVTEELHELMAFDPRLEHTIVDASQLRNQGADFTEGYQNTDLFIRKYAPLAAERAADGEVALNWGNNIREIRYADVLLMAAEAHARAGNDGAARPYLFQVRQRVGLQPPGNLAGQDLLDAIYRERRLELATEGHRYFDLVRTRRAATVLADEGFVAGKHELMPIPQAEIDITEGNLKQNPGY
ncbi:MAG: RagB/SusD family nutrient uptake outer membrane protein [Bacteroidota bacterium]